MTVSELASELNRKYPGRVFLLADQRTFLLTGATASRTLTIETGDDAVRISAGRIVHAEVFEHLAGGLHVCMCPPCVAIRCAGRSCRAITIHHM